MARRVIFLVDMNAFFISCETTRDPSLAGRPAAVAGDPKRRSGIIFAANYEARAFGVKTTMTIFQALKRCPELRLVPPDHHFYSARSREVMKLLGEYTPVIEQNSIDEAWLDMTGCERLSGEPLTAARSIMEQIRSRLGLWCSIGISENKFLAKMASDMKKPQGITELWKKDLPEKLWPLPVEAIYGVGARTAEKLRSLGLRTIGDVARFGATVLPASFGKYGAELCALANGEDDQPVAAHRPDEMKSIGRSTTLPTDISDFTSASRILAELAEEVAADARRHDKRATTVHISVKYADFSTITRQATVKPTCLTREIASAAVALLRKNWSSRPVRLLGLSVSGFDEGMTADQLTFFDLPGREMAAEREERLDRAVDDIRRRFGRAKLKRAAFLTPADGGAQEDTADIKKPPGRTRRPDG